MSDPNRYEPPEAPLADREALPTGFTRSALRLAGRSALGCARLHGRDVLGVVACFGRMVYGPFQGQVNVRLERLVQALFLRRLARMRPLRSESTHPRAA